MIIIVRKEYRIMKNKCCICGRDFEGYGNNPAPVIDDPKKRCCDECNEAVVIRARFLAYLRQKQAA